MGILKEASSRLQRPGKRDSSKNIGTVISSIVLRLPELDQPMTPSSLLRNLRERQRRPRRRRRNGFQNGPDQATRERSSTRTDLVPSKGSTSAEEDERS